MKSALLLCALLAAGCASSASARPAPSGPLQTTSASVSPLPGFASSKGDKAEATRSRRSLRATALWKSRCESGDDGACLVAGTFAR